MAYKKLFVLILTLVLSIEAAKRIKTCNTSNGESPNRKIYMANCADQYTNIYYCGTGDANKKGDWQDCTALGVGEDKYYAIKSDLENHCGDMWGDDDDANELFLTAYYGNEKDALCIEDIDYEDILTTFCDDVGRPGAFSNSAGNCESFGWGLLKEYSRLWIEVEDDDDRCGSYFFKRGSPSNGQETLVIGALDC